jgi:hypothetical protein
MIPPTAICATSICAHASRRSFRRPTLSARTMETTVATTLTPPVTTAERREPSVAKPIVWNSTGA